MGEGQDGVPPSFRQKPESRVSNPLILSLSKDSPLMGEGQDGGAW